MKDTITFAEHEDQKVRRFDDSVAAFGTDIPCVVYECTSDLVVKRVSGNSLKLLGIQPEAITGNQSLWRERLLEDDRLRLRARLSQIGLSDVASETHRIEDDRGLRIWVAHSFQLGGETAAIHGCILPLTAEFQSRFIESSTISQFIHKIGNHFQLIDLLIGSFRRIENSLAEIVSLQNTIDRAVEFVQSFSNFSQPMNAHERLNLEEVLNSLGVCYGSKHTPIELAIHSSLRRATLAGDGFLLESAFAAVVQNAVEASESGSPIVVSAGLEELVNGAPAMAWVSIRDLGHGIESSAVTRVVEPFFSTRRDRNGLGLSSAVRIFEMHGGAVHLSSTGRGTEVRVRLPVQLDCGQISVRHV